MEPRLFSRGNVSIADRLGIQQAASMEPRLFSRGNPGEYCHVVFVHPGFNGAAAFQPRKWVVRVNPGLRLTPVLQWSRGFSAAEIEKLVGSIAVESMLQWSRGFSAAEITLLIVITPLSMACFNGAAAFLPQKWERTSRISDKPVDSFNGAAAFQPRKSGCLRLIMPPDHSFNGAAAFQPRKCNITRQRTHVVHSFNGAAAFQPRKSRITSPSSISAYPLQWSRGFSAAEMGRPLDGLLWPSIASMEPRLFSRGNVRQLPAKYLVGFRFNGAAAFQPRKSPTTLD